ncbi:LacI family DNA-binding transcriptional regulator [Pectobacterium cacticida]|uniref:LacI family DNA-binding transcriptional regulator n=1 Tax=Pectobacterium cacticida TaxID=69221 RepID=UPI002FEE8A93
MKGNLKIREIAQRTGYSNSTVSRVLSGQSNTSEQAKASILNCARQCGVLTELANGRLLLNGVTIFAPSRAFDLRSDIYYHKVVQSIIDALKPHDVRVRYCGLEENDSDATLFLNKIREPSTEAALLIGIDDPYIHALAADSGKPCILINAIDRKMRLPSVAPAHRLIGEFSAHYLFEQGHHSVLTLLCPRRYTMELRLEGIRDAYLQHNLPFSSGSNWLPLDNFSSTKAEEAMTTYLSHHPPDKWPTAILAGGDFIAVGAVDALYKAGLRVPQDMSVMSMDGFNLAAIHDIPLTSVHVPREALGEEAIRQLQYRLIRPDAAISNVLLNGTLVVRASVRRWRTSKSVAPVQSERLYD